MSKSYAQIQKQIAALTREAERLKQQEVDGVIARIKEAIRIYGLTAADLGLDSAARAQRGAGRRPRRGAKAKTAGIVKFRDEAGNTWGGRGPRPQWLRTALASGKKLEDFKA